jgi:hypothetical protein
MGRDFNLRGYNLAMTARTLSLSACLLASLTAIILINFNAEPTMATMSGLFPVAMIVRIKVDPDGAYMFASGLGLILLSLGSRRLLRKHLEK